MSLHLFQRSILTLYSNTGELERFLAAPEEWSRDSGLSLAEADALTTIPREQLVGFQKMLHRKSMGIARKLLSQNRRALVLTVLHPEAPVLLWQEHSTLRTLHLSPSLYRQFHYLAREKQRTSFGTLALSLLRDPTSSYKDVANLISNMIRSKLFGRIIYIPLVL
ncbi:MAG: hypothetical protein JWO50_366 [Candidatus Kaiserbacteria bacterium]|nr:hypothetical protein [Candidatus Kaiserbacteria bacterium]